MTRLIDADALKIALYYDVSKGTYCEFMDGSEVSYTDKEILKLIDEQPTIDAIPIEWILNNERMPKEGKGRKAIMDMLEDWRKEHDQTD